MSFMKGGPGPQSYGELESVFRLRPPLGAQCSPRQDVVFAEQLFLMRAYFSLLDLFGSPPSPLPHCLPCQRAHSHNFY